MTFEILSADGQDGARWAELISALPSSLRDVHYLPEYGRIYRDSYGYEPLLALFQDGSDFVLQPFVRRSLGQLPFLANDPGADHFSDIANAYGFGGPLSNVASAPAANHLYGRFAEAFAGWCEKAGIASEFASLHPFFAEHQLALVEGFLKPAHEKDVYYIDLTQTEEQIWRGLRRGHRGSINLALRHGIEVKRVPPTPENLAILNRLYNGSMDRRRAASRWLFPESYFADTMKHLGEQGSSIFFGYSGARVASAYILIHGFDTVYYHFSGTSPDDGRIGIDTLMFHKMALWAREAGYAKCHMGGGATRRTDDGLLKFKAGFGGASAPLYTYFSIRSPSVYDALCARKRSFELESTGRESPSSFLPQYRR